jgi:hypothetical protein
MIYALRGPRSRAAHTLAAPITRIIVVTALVAQGLSEDPFHEPFHARRIASRRLFTVRNVTEGTASRAHEHAGHHETAAAITRPRYQPAVRS